MCLCKSTLACTELDPKLFFFCTQHPHPNHTIHKCIITFIYLKHMISNCNSSSPLASPSSTINPICLFSISQLLYQAHNLHNRIILPGELPSLPRRASPIASSSPINLAPKLSQAIVLANCSFALHDRLHL